MDAKEKQEKLDELLSDVEVTHVEKRVYKDDNGFYRYHDVAVADKFLGFVPIEIPNPELPPDEQLEALVEIYGDSVLVKSCLNAIAIKMQQDCRKLSKGDRKITQAEFDKRFNALDADILHRLKTMEYIRKHIIEQWLEAQTNVSNGELRLF